MVWIIICKMAFICEVCRTNFTRSNNLKRHQHLYHPDLAPVLVTDASALGKTASTPVRATPAGIVQQKYLMHPFTMMIAGPTSCGKTVLLKQILENQIIKPVPVHIVWYYKIWQPLYSEMISTVPGISFVEGLPNPDELIQNPEIPRLFVLDDLMVGGMEN